MTGITLNLASRPFRNNTIVGSVLAAVLAALIGVTIYNGYVFLNYGGTYRQLQEEEKRQRDRLAALESDERSLSRQFQTRDFRRLYGRGQFAGDLILRRSFSWTLLFNRLEALVPPEVMMTAIRPHITGEKTVIRVDGIAKNHGGLIVLEDSLQKNPVFARVYPVYERRVNPNRPEIDFALDFDYIPAEAPPGPDAIAAAGKAPAPGQAVDPAPPAPPASAAAPTPGPGTASPVAAAAPSAGYSQAAPAGARQVIGTVGRDGRPRTPDLLARVVAAPGGFYPSSPPKAPQAPAEVSTRKSKGKPREPRPGAVPNAPAVAPAQTGVPPPGSPATPANGGASSSLEQAGRIPPGYKRPLSPATSQNGATALQTREPLAAGLPKTRDSGVRPRPGNRQRGTDVRGSGPTPAMRLDVPLTFQARPVGDVYTALSQAHGVRIEIDPTVDKGAKVTANLAGKSLRDAFASVSKLAGHRVVRVEEGLYRVVSVAGGEPLADHPVQEEPPAGGEVKP